MYNLMNLSKQDHRENEGTLLLDLKSYNDTNQFKPLLSGTFKIHILRSGTNSYINSMTASSCHKKILVQMWPRVHNPLNVHAMGGLLPSSGKRQLQSTSKEISLLLNNL
jgi:hypothetical protein